MLGMNTVIHREILVIELEGALDSHTSADFKSWVEEKLLEGWRAFILDCLCLEYLSSRGIGVLNEIGRITANAKGKIVVTNLSAEVKNLFHFVQLDKQLAVFDTVESARDSLKEYIRVLPTPVAVNTAEPETVAHSDAAQASQTGQPENKPPEENFVVPEPVIDEDIYLPEAPPSITKLDSEPHANGEKPEPKDTPAGPPPMLLYEEKLEENSEVQPPENPPEQPAAGDQKTEEPKNEPEPKPEPVPQGQSLVFPTIRPCANCGAELRLPKAGTYICPACRHRFIVA
jgi:anti-anti-sigma factor